MKDYEEKLESLAEEAKQEHTFEELDHVEDTLHLDQEPIVDEPLLEKTVDTVDEIAENVLPTSTEDGIEESTVNPFLFAKRNE